MISSLMHKLSFKILKYAKMKLIINISLFWGFICFQIFPQVSSKENEGSLGNIEFSCPAGQYFNGGYCFSIVDVPMIWRDAERTCKRQGQHLFWVLDVYELKAVDHLAKSTWENYWSGLSRSESWLTTNEALWSNVNKTLQLEEFVWEDDQPDTGYGDCVHIKKDGYGTFDNCLRKLPFVCKAEAVLKGYFRCRSGEGIQSKFVCDGHNDCHDMSDEANCASRCHHVINAEYGSGDAKPSGEIVSTNDYLNSRSCIWSIVTNVGSIIKVQVKSFNIEKNADIMELRTGGREGEIFLAELTGTVNNQPVYYSSDNVFNIRLVTDSTVIQSGGFRISWTTDVAEVFNDVQMLTATSSVQHLKSSLYDTGYLLKEKVFEWKITASMKNIITLEFSNMDIGTDAKLYLWNQDDISLTPTLDGVSFFTSKYYISKSRSIRLMLISGKGEAQFPKGIYIKYWEGCSINEMTTEGTIHSPGYIIGSYPENIECTWTIQRPTSETRTLALRFNKFDIQSQGDYLKIYNDTSEALQTGERFTGTADLTNNFEVRSTNGYIKLVFTTNYVLTDKGFEAEFSLDCQKFAVSTETHFISKSKYETTFGNIVDFSCDEGYSFVNEGHSNKISISCQKGGEWNTPRIPYCIDTYCPIPPAVDNGYIVVSIGVKVGNTLTYQCNDGFTINGQQVIRCLPDGSWEEAPRCTTSRCFSLTKPENGDIKILTGDGRDFASVVQYVCNPGYETYGNVTTYCQTGGKWSHVPPSCEKINCPMPKIQRGNLSSTDTLKFEDLTTLTCDSGFGINGIDKQKQLLKCESDGRLLPYVACLDTSCKMIRQLNKVGMDSRWAEALSQISIEACEQYCLENQTCESIHFESTTCFIYYQSTLLSDKEGAMYSKKECSNKQYNVVHQLICPLNKTIYINSANGEVFNVSDVVSVRPSDSKLKFIFSPAELIALDHSAMVEQTRVVVTARDKMGVENQCSFFVETKAGACFRESFPASVLNAAHVTCTSSNISCTVTCNSGYVFFDGNTTKTYDCTGQNMWLPALPPDTCIKYSQPFYTIIVLQVGYKTDHNKFAEDCKAGHDDKIKTNNESLTKDIYDMCNNNFVSAGPVVIRNTETTTTGFGFMTSFTIELLTTELNKNKDKDVCKSLLQIQVENDEFLDYTGSVQCKCGTTTVTRNTSDSSNQVVRSENQCDNGISKMTTVYSSSKCIPCPPGTYSGIGDECNICPDGKFQSNFGQNECLDCPAGNPVPSEDKTTCLAVCPAGFISTDGLPTCAPCPEDHYWVNITYCEPCPNSCSTAGKNAITDINGCKDASCEMIRQQNKAGKDLLWGEAPRVISIGACEQYCLLNQNCDSIHYESNTCFIYYQTTLLDDKDVAVYSKKQCSNTIFLDASCEMISMPNKAGEDVKWGEDPKILSTEDCEKYCLDNQNCESVHLEFTSDGRAYCFIYYQTTIPFDKDGALYFKKQCSDTQLINCKNNIDNCVGMCTGSNVDPNTNRCKDLLNDYRCICKAGYTGKNCNEEIDECLQEYPCEHGGTCTDKVADFQCSCREGWTGKRCETPMEYCAPSPCLNGGVCFNLTDGYFCRCPGGTTGVTCGNSPEVCSIIDPCTIKGNCEDKGGTAQCNCNDDYAGTSCQLIKNHCADPNTCENNGKCVTKPIGFKCECGDSYSGSTCSLYTDPCSSNPCHSTAKCISNTDKYICYCEQGNVLTDNGCKDIITKEENFDIFMDRYIDGMPAYLRNPFVSHTNDSMTIMFWIRVLARHGENPVLVSLEKIPIGTIIPTFNTSIQQLIVRGQSAILRSSTETDYIQYGTDVADGKWHFMVFSLEPSGKVKLFIDSIKKTEYDRMSGVLNFNEYVSWQVIFGSTDTLGRISKLRIYKTVFHDIDVYKAKDNTSHLPSDQLIQGWTNIKLTWSTFKKVPSGAGNDNVCDINFPNCLDEDKKKPKISCPDDQMKIGTERLTAFTGLKNKYIKNEDVKYVNTSVHYDELYTYGSSNEVFVAYDEALNYGICRFKVYVKYADCPRPETNADISYCPNSKHICELNCPSGEALCIKHKQKYRCGALGVYNFEHPRKKLILPTCGGQQNQTIALSVSLTYKTVTNCVPTFPSNIKTGLEVKLRTDLPNLWPMGAGMTWCGSQCIWDAICRGTSTYIDITFTLHVPQLSASIERNGKTYKIREALFIFILQENGLNFNNVAGAQLERDSVNIYESTSCPDGYMVVREQCVKCGKGTYRNDTTMTCEFCAIGSYQTNVGGTVCEPCESSKTTLNFGSDSSTDCIDNCPPGQYYVQSTSGCVPCEKHYYQHMSGQDFCYPCPHRTITSEKGSNSSNSCYRKNANEGSVPNNPDSGEISAEMANTGLIIGLSIGLVLLLCMVISVVIVYKRLTSESDYSVPIDNNQYQVQSHEHHYDEMNNRGQQYLNIGSIPHSHGLSNNGYENADDNYATITEILSGNSSSNDEYFELYEKPTETENI